MRATGRVVDADQCGVPLEKRFAFYDQIHTTGMDIRHVVNATAVITLGKDMVSRDYFQGAFRMRGIGAGQKIHLFVIPEVRELMNRELGAAGRTVAPISDGSNADEDRSVMLADVCAWLVINSMRSEQTQWTMLQIQNISNLYRKNAFLSMHGATARFVEQLDASAPPMEVDTFASPGTVAALHPQESLKVFDEPIDFSLEAAVPDPMRCCITMTPPALPCPLLHNHAPS